MPDQRDNPTTDEVRLALQRLLSSGRSYGWLKKCIGDAGITIQVSQQSFRDFIKGKTRTPLPRVIDPLRAACLHYAWHLHSDVDDIFHQSAMYRALWRFFGLESQDVLRSATAIYRIFFRSQEYENHIVAGVLRLFEQDGMFFFEEYQTDKATSVVEVHNGVVVRKVGHNYFLSTDNSNETMRMVITIETRGTRSKTAEIRGSAFGVNTSYQIFYGPYIMWHLDDNNSPENFELAKERCYRLEISEIPPEDKIVISRLSAIKK